MAAEIGLERYRQRYQHLWGQILLRFREAQSQRKNQRQLADMLDTSEAALSRVLRGRELTRSMMLLVHAAETLGARPEEIRVLLAWASGIQAAESGEHSVAAYFFDMFRPLYPERTLADRLNRVDGIAYNILVDIGIAAEDALKAAHELSNQQGAEAALGHLLSSENHMLKKAIKSAGLDQIVALSKIYSQIAVIDFDGPQAKRRAVRSLRRGEQRGDFVAKAWDLIPNVGVTRIIVAPHRSVDDVGHKGFEALFLEDGDGQFSLQGLDPVALRKGDRQLIAYRPKVPHRFTAGSHGARLYVISYDRPGEGDDPTADLVPS